MPAKEPFSGESNLSNPAALMSEVVNSIHEVLWLRDLAEERIVYVSPSFVRVWGRPVESVLASPKVWTDSIHPDDRERVLSAAVSDGRTMIDHIEYRILRPDGTVRWIYDRCYPIKNAQGRVTRLAGIVEDITDRRPPASS
jgi:PAS domain S-box-containing protein